MTLLERSRPVPARWGALARRAAARLDPAGFGRELALVAVGGLAYFLIRGGVVDRAAEAFARAGDLIELERRLGIFWEPAMQDWILGSRVLIDLSNAVYFWLHMPLIAAMGLWLFWRKREVYRLTRNAFLGSAVVALICYAALPVAPPRFFPELGFVDTMALYSQASYQAQEVGVFVNPYAALPSLHFGWALLLGLALWWARPRGRWTWAFAAGALLIPAGQAISIVLTGNHFILDAVAGAAVAGLGLAMALVWRRRRPSGRVTAGEGVA
jgi:membrane-associated phospholipid phosphatase